MRRPLFSFLSVLIVVTFIANFCWAQTAAAGATTLQVAGNIRVGTSGTNGCVQNFAGTALTGSCSSDARLKTNITPFASVLSKVVQLQPVHYHWRSQEFPDYHFGEALNSGLIAQEVEKVFPEMVGVDAHGYRTVNYSELPYLLLGAVRELKAENDALLTNQAKLSTETELLKAENDAKERHIRQLSERVEQMQKVQQQLTSVEARLERLEKRPTAELKKANAAKKTKKPNGPAPSTNRPAVVAQARPSN